MIAPKQSLGIELVLEPSKLGILHGTPVTELPLGLEIVGLVVVAARKWLAIGTHSGECALQGGPHFGKLRLEARHAPTPFVHAFDCTRLVALCTSSTQLPERVAVVRNGVAL